ncbi:MAG: 1,2-phenylacetyl-CoA epoxidase subunit A, partial [Acetobacteraceae bacterium]|nr:1,2-phenylacetyl-CoA epoxidase subunit A [Acetobacteraceae bacterium]
MYTQGLERMAASGEPELAQEDPAGSARFQSRIDQEDRIEPND